MAWTDASQLVLKLYTDVPTDERIRTLQAVISASEKNNVITVKDNGKGPGKKRALKLVYFAPNCNPNTSCSTSICDGEAREPIAEDFVISNCISSETYTLDIDNVRQVDDGSFELDDYALNTLKEQMNQVRRGLNAALAAKLVTYQGKFSDNSDIKQIPFVDPQTGSLNPRGYFEIERSVQEIGMKNPYIIGGQDVFMWEKGVMIGGLNQHGQRVDALPYGNAYWDPTIEAAAGDNTKGHIFAFSANAIKLVTYVKNVGQFANAAPTTLDGFNKLSQMFRSSDSYLRGAVVDPMTGLMYNLSIERIACTDSFNMQVSVEWDLYNLPQMLCNIPGVTGVFHFTTCLPVEALCPSPSQPLPPAPVAYIATVETADFPMALTSVTVGASTYPIGATVNNQVQLAAALTTAIPGYHFSGSNTNQTVSFVGYQGLTVNVVVNPTSDNFTLNFTS